MTDKEKFMLKGFIVYATVATILFTLFDVKVLHYRVWTTVLGWVLYNIFYWVVLRPLIERYIIAPAVRRALAKRGVSQ